MEAAIAVANVFADKGRGENALESSRSRDAENMTHLSVDNEVATWKALVSRHPEVRGLQAQLAKAISKKEERY